MWFIWLGLGIVCGVIVNYLADVLPVTRRLSVPLWWPISQASLRVYLKKTRVLVVLACLAVLSILIYVYPPNNSDAFQYFVVLAFLLLVAIIDIEHRLVLHPVSLFGAVVMGVVGMTRHGLVSTLIGGVVGFSGMLLFYLLGGLLGRWLARLRGQEWNEVALGFGDVTLAGVIGLLMGWPGVIAALFVGMFIAGVYSGLLILWMLVRRKYSAFTAIAYAPFLCLGAAAMITLAVYL